MNPSIHVAQVLPARAVLFLGIAGFHALLAYAFASGLISTTIHILRPEKPIEFFEVTERNPPPPPAPIPTPTRFIASIVDPTPLPPINPEVDPPPVASEPLATALIGPTAGPGPVAPPPIHLVGRNVMPATADYYPAAEIRFGHEGTTEIRSCVDVNGRLDGSPVVEASSGRPSLDKAAVRLAQDGKYARAMRGDMPVPNCYRFRVTFTLH
jgi:periplasmic protein TonB